MVDVWLDSVTPKDSLLVSSLLSPLHKKGYKTIVTAKKQTQTTDVLELLNIPYTCVGKYGETLREKLAEEQKRTLGFVELFDKIGLPKVLWTHGDVGAIRTAFGLQIPVVYSNDTPQATHVARLVCPLVDWLIVPVCFGKSWTKYGISTHKIIMYDGIEEVGWLKEKTKERPKLLKELAEKKKVVLFRNAEYKAAYYKDIDVDSWRVLKEVSKMATVLYMPRYEEEKTKLQDYPNVIVPQEAVLTYQIIPEVDLMIGSGGTICRETALLGVPTINYQFWDAAAKYLHKKSFPMKRVTNTDSIIRIAKKILEAPEKHRMDTRQMLRNLESPAKLTVQYIEKFL
jgi:predicted glycosyltransferase